MKRIYGYMLGFSSLFMINMVYAQSTCVEPPSCGSLGYFLQSNYCISSVKCPFDTSKVICMDPQEYCEVGSILYSDKSCSKRVKMGMIPIGVVFDTEKRLAMFLVETPTGKDWRGSGTNIVSLIDCTDSATVLSCNPNGKVNTRKIVDKLKPSLSSAAGYCNNVYTTGTVARDWFLPSLQELNLLYKAKAKVNASLELLDSKAKILKDDYYWSSTEFNSSDAWKLNMGDGSMTHSDKAGISLIRPVVIY